MASWSLYARTGIGSQNKLPTTTVTQTVRECIMTAVSRLMGTLRTPSRALGLEPYTVEPFEQGLGVLLITGLAGIVGAQGHTAHASELLSRYSRVGHLNERGQPFNAQSVRAMIEG